MAATDKIYSEKDFDEQWLICPNCGWRGTGAETIVIDMYGIGDARLVNCPQCDTNLGNLPYNTSKGEAPDELSNQIG